MHAALDFGKIPFSLPLNGVQAVLHH